MSVSFCFWISAFIDCYYNEYPVKKTASLYLKFAFETCIFLVCFSYFWKEKSLLFLNLYIYFWMSRPNSSMEGDEGGIFSKAPDWKSLKIKIKQKSGCPNNEYSAIFKHIIHQDIRTSPWSKKKSWSINDWEKFFAY